MKKSQLQFEQLERKLKPFKAPARVNNPENGWVNTIRLSLGMSLEQLGFRLNISRQSAKSIEIREVEGSITMKALREAGSAMEMNLVYGFFPKDGSIEKLIERRAGEIATEIVVRTSGTMNLEDQGNEPSRIKRAIEERAKEIINERPKLLWD